MNDDGPIMLFDGDCALCNGVVQFILDHEKQSSIRFASLQSEVGQRYLNSFGLESQNFNSYVMIDNGCCYLKSRAIYKMGYYMGGIWRVLARLSLLLPKFLGDRLYSAGFKRRYRWFGKNTQCRLLRPEQRARFLDIGSSGFLEQE